MADNTICSEVLFFVNNNYGKTPVNNMAAIISSFYEENELCAAKAILHTVATQFLPDDPDVPRLKTRRAGDNKRRLDADDILSLFACLDVKKVTMPVFAAVKSSRVPSIKPSDADICSLSATVADLRDQVSEVIQSVKSLVESNLIKQVCDLTATVNQLRVQLAEVVSSAQPQPMMNIHVDDANNKHNANPLSDNLPICVNSTSFANLVKELNNNINDWQTKTTKKERRLIHGSAVRENCTLTSSIDHVDKDKDKKGWHVFASRLHSDTTTDDVTDFLNDSGITVIKCEKLMPKEEWQRKSAAFHILVDFKCKDAVFNDTLWPHHVMVRDWYFKERVANNHANGVPLSTV